jgi:hypothetical protein
MPLSLAAKKFVGFVPLCKEKCNRLSRRALLVFFFSYGFWELTRLGPNPTDWDMLLLSGVATFAIGLWLAGRIKTKMEQDLDHLAARGSINIEPKQLASFKGMLELQAEGWARGIGFVSAIAILLAFVVAFWGRFSGTRIVLITAEVTGGYIAGTFLGRMACYGRLGSLFERHLIDLLVYPDHVDGAAGLKSIGDHYFFQAIVVSIPAVFLAVWWFLIPFWPRYEYWRDPYLVLLAFAITIEILAFAVPLWWFHKTMRAKKEEALHTADALSQEINELRARLAAKSLTEDKDILTNRLSEKSRQYWAIKTMPTWPVDFKAWRLFGLNNFLLFLPIVSNYIGTAEPLRQLIDIIKRLDFNV